MSVSAILDLSLSSFEKYNVCYESHIILSCLTAPHCSSWCTSYFVTNSQFGHFLFPRIESQANTKQRTVWLTSIALKRVSPGPEYLSQTINIKIGIGLSFLESNDFVVIQSRVISNTDSVCMKPHELVILLDVSASSCGLVQKWLEVRSKSYLNDFTAQELDFFGNDMSI